MEIGDRTIILFLYGALLELEVFMIKNVIRNRVIYYY